MVLCRFAYLFRSLTATNHPREQKAAKQAQKQLFGLKAF
jgi:hypothetical protein